MKLRVYPDRGALARALAGLIAEDLRRALADHGHAALAVAGGTSPGPVFDVLAQSALDWPRVTVLPTDERWVAPDHPRANAGLITRRLVTGQAAQARYLPLFVPDAAPAQGLERLTRNLDNVLPLSAALLGMGEDMHTASLFPGTAGLEAALAPDAPPLAILRPESQPETRISLTAPVLRAARARHLLIFGAAKRSALDRAMGLAPHLAPVAAVMQGTTVHWAE